MWCVNAQVVMVDQIDIGAHARRQATTVGHAEEAGRLGSLRLHHRFDRQLRASATVACPVGQKLSRHAGGDDRTDLGTAIAQPAQCAGV